MRALFSKKKNSYEESPRSISNDRTFSPKGAKTTPPSKNQHKVHPFGSHFDNMAMFHTGASMDNINNCESPQDGIVEFPNHLENNQSFNFNHENDNNNESFGLEGIGIDDINICFWTDDLNIFNDDSIFKINDYIGIGGFGIVLKVSDITSSLNDHYAMKVISKKKIVNDCNQQLNEINTMAKVCEGYGYQGPEAIPFLQEVYGIYEDDSNVYIISEYINGGDLFYYLSDSSSSSSFTFHQVKVMLAELYLAIEFMHTQSVIHRDIKIENIMLNKLGHIKLIDYGLSVNLDDSEEDDCYGRGRGRNDSSTSRNIINDYSSGGGGDDGNGGDILGEGVQRMDAMGSLPYMSPELIKEHIGGRFTDWWAYGIVAYELLTGGYSPWNTLNDGEDSKIINEILNSNVILPKTSIFQNLDSDSDQNSKDFESAQLFISSLLTREYHLRLGTKNDEEIKNSEFFKSINFDDILHLKHSTSTSTSSSRFIPPKEVTSLSNEDKNNIKKSYENMLLNDNLSNLCLKLKSIEIEKQLKRENETREQMLQSSRRRSSSFTSNILKQQSSSTTPSTMRRKSSYDSSHSLSHRIVIPIDESILSDITHSKEEETLIKLIEDIKNCSFGLKPFPQEIRRASSNEI